MDTRLTPKSFHSNKCDFCYQAGVPVKSLSCRNHFYCGVCERFAPKFYKKNDYSCNRCLVHPSRFTPTKVCMQSTTKKKPVFEEVTCTIVIDSGNVLTFDDNDTDSENDLEGNNVEWDHLLESMTSSQPNQKVDKSTKGLQEKPLRLDLSAINKSDGQESPTIGRSRKSRDEKIQECTSPNFVGGEYNLGQGSSETEAEQERGSSPVKGIKKKSMFPTKSSDESDLELLDGVEGPDLEPLDVVVGPDLEPLDVVVGPDLELLDGVEGPDLEPLDVVVGPDLEPLDVVVGPDLEPLDVVVGPDLEPLDVVVGPDLKPLDVVEGPDLEPLGDMEGRDFEPLGDVEGPDFEPLGDVEGPELSDGRDSSDDLAGVFWAL
ncbi:uncharacterized protein LOC125649648 [Ostrea edulis]|uniref:uncharacterized protein LOC125649648 n=1 Tax=Ostrea edulis TaxID=37623 RepID=UPI0024AFFF34|nr:uncharacterized protein LOC125649648 [Ostrea edulis]